MMDIAGRNERRQRPLALGVFEPMPMLFLGTALLLLAFMAVAEVHELIPGLCTADDSLYECPFCKLIHTIVVIAALAVCLVRLMRSISGVSRRSESPLTFQPTSGYLLRAPPAL